MKALILFLTVLLLTLQGQSQNFVQGSIQQGATPNAVNVTYRPNYTNTGLTGEYVNYLSISIAIPLASATGVTPTITGVGNFSTLTFLPATPFSYTQGSEKIFSWACPNGTPLTMTWTANTPFVGATITFSGGVGGTKVRMVDFTTLGGGSNGNTFFNVGVNKPPFDLTNYTNFFYAITGSNGSTLGTYPSMDQYVETNLPILFSSTCPGTSAPTVNNITTTTADVSWTAVPGSIGYEYAVDNSAVPPASGTATTATTYSATGLTPATQYYAHVRSGCVGGGFSGWVNTPFNTQNATCTAPSSPVITNVTAASGDISWGTVSGSVGYEYAVDNSSTPPSSNGTATTGTTYNATGLTSGTTYYVHVRSDCGSLFSSWVSTPFTTDCPATTLPVVSMITAAGAVIDWTPVGGGASGYEYAITTSATPPSSGTSTTATTYTASDLTPGTVYYAYVRTACNGGNFSAWLSATFTTVCPATTTPVVTNVTPTNAVINWSAVSGTTGYEYAVTTSSTAPSSGTFINATTYNTNSSLTPGTTYYVYIRSSCSAGIFSDWASASFATPFPTCDLPIPVTVTVSNTGPTADISWPDISGAIGYEYVVSTSSTTPASAPGTGTATTATTYQATGLNPNTQYYAHVRTQCNANNFSGWVSKPFKTSCFQPTPFVIGNDSYAGTAELGWNKIPGAQQYEYSILSYGVPPGGSLNFTTDTVLQASRLGAGSKYYLHVRAHCASASISQWGTLAFHTSGLEAHPNPFSSILTINLYGIGSSTGQVMIYDAMGKLVKQLGMPTSTLTIDTRGLLSGIYLVKYIDGKNKYSLKVMKE